ncbi:hypothetical protein [Salinifilum aidingensis]
MPGANHPFGGSRAKRAPLKWKPRRFSENAEVGEPMSAVSFVLVLVGFLLLVDRSERSGAQHPARSRRAG